MGIIVVKTKEKLLKNKNVIEEINRHRWIESERAGHDIGFDNASIDWLDRFSKAWMQYHMPKRMTSTSSKSKSTLRKKTKPIKNRSKLKQ